MVIVMEAEGWQGKKLGGGVWAALSYGWGIDSELDQWEIRKRRKETGDVFLYL